MAALTLARLLSPEWTHVVTKREFTCTNCGAKSSDMATGRCPACKTLYSPNAKAKPVLDAQGRVIHETIRKPAGQLSGDRASIEARLAALLGGLGLSAHPDRPGA
jgi:hypothetical protein